jgi:dihydrolipoamide dehydrogenase
MQFDCIVIGGGPAGYVAAIRAAQLGMKVACIEKRGTYGGTCLNVGCIPSKSLLDSSERFYEAKTHFKKHGIEFSELQLNLSKMMERKDTVVKQLVGGVAALLKKHKVETRLGFASLMGSGGGRHKVRVALNGGATEDLETKFVLLATGSEPAQLPFLPFDGTHVLSSTEALCLTQVPEHLVVIGGGVIGLEMGSVWSRLGAKVTVIEYLDHVAGNMDLGTSKELQKCLQKQGLEFRLETQCEGAHPMEKGMKVLVKHRKTHEVSELLCDKVLVCTGRRPFTEGLGLEHVGIERDSQGRIPVNESLETQVKGIFAVGDIVRGPMLAHKAEEEGIAAVETMHGQAGHVNYKAIPNVIYTWPEFATVGETEEELKAAGRTYKVGQFPFLANGRAKAMDQQDGFVKVLSDAKTDRLLGVHIIGPWASDLIAEATTVMEFGGSAEDIARTCHAHPTLSEAVKEAAMAVDKWQIHY